MLASQRVRRLPMSRDEFFEQAAIRENCMVDWEHGEAIQSGPAHSRHGFFMLRLGIALDTHLTDTGRGRLWQEVFVDFSDVTYGADIVVLLPERYAIHQKGRFVGAPDIIVEVISEDSAARDRTVKLEAYHRHGVPWYWIGDPAAGTLEEYRHTPDGYLHTTSGTLEMPFSPRALPGLTVDVGRLIEPE